MHFTRRIVLFVFFLSCVYKFASAQESSQCSAVLTGVSGDVTIIRTGSSVPVKAVWGTQLFQGDQVKTTAASDATLTLSNNTILRLGANSTITVSGTDYSATTSSGDVKRVSSAMMVNFPALTEKREVKKDAGILAGLRSGNNAQAVEPLFPQNTYIKTTRPSFSWHAKKSYGNFAVNLYNSKGLVWSKRTTNTTLQYPEGEKDLEFGETYFWNVEGEELIETEKSANSRFYVLPAEKFREVREQELIIKDTFRDHPENCGLHSVLGTYYLDQGLLQDAINEFEIISGLNTDAPLPHEILGSLYFETGNKDKAIEELKLALSLAKSSPEK